jgi:hypothetical protein
MYDGGSGEQGTAEGRETAEVRTRALLDAWERAAVERPAARVLTLLHRTGAETFEELSGLSVGQRDRRLLELRRRLFGPTIAALVSCPACAETVELEFELDAILVPSAPADERPATVDVDVDGHTLRVRVPTAADLVAAGEQPTPESGRDALLAALLVPAADGAAPPAGALAEGAVALIDSALAAADPQADILLGASCPACDTSWESPFDVGAFLWSELDDWATRLMWEIQALAAAYGWREADALSLSPTRRRFYVEAAHA